MKNLKNLLKLILLFNILLISNIALCQGGQHPIPIDGGLVFLIISGLSLGIYKLRGKKGK